MNKKYLEVLENSSLFHGFSKKDIDEIMNSLHYSVLLYGKGETVFRLMENADRLGIILEGYVQIQKFFPNGSQINVSAKGKGELIGSAAVFSKEQRYPCDIIALEETKIMIIHKTEMTKLMQKNNGILQNFITDISSATYMLQQRLELLSYNGIAQKIAFYLLIQERKTGRKRIRIPESVTNWAMVMNVSRTSLHRELKKMNDEGIIAYASPFISINDSDRLMKFLDH